jgi:septum site-determining protein MinD
LSTKGGVGKTFIVTNLTSILSKLGYKTIAIDANFTSPHLAMHLGYQLAKKTLHDVLREQISLKEAIYLHPLGFKLIPGSLSVVDLIDLKVEKFGELIEGLKGEADFIFIDCAPGLGREALIGLRSCKEVLIVSNPELASTVDALKTARMARMLDKQVLGLVLNRVGKSKKELKVEKIERITRLPILAKIPEDKNVLDSIEAKRPLVNFKPSSPAALAILGLSFKILGIRLPTKKSLIDKIFGWFR